MRVLREESTNRGKDLPLCEATVVRGRGNRPLRPAQTGRTSSARWDVDPRTAGTICYRIACLRPCLRDSPTTLAIILARSYFGAASREQDEAARAPAPGHRR